MARKSNGKATYCVFDSLNRYPVINDGNFNRLNSKSELFYVKDWSKVDFRNVKIVKFGGAGYDWDDPVPFVNRLKNYNTNPSIVARMYRVRLHNIDTHEEMRETELHRFIKANPERTGLRYCKTEVREKNEWYKVENPEKFSLWMYAASLENGVLPRVPNDMTQSQRKVLDESKQKIRIYDNLFWYLATRFRKSGTCLELNRQEVKANFIVVISPISESIYSYREVINSFQGFEDYELIESSNYGSDINALKSDVSKKLIRGKTVVYFATWSWFKSEGEEDKTKWNLMDGIEGVKKTFIVVDEFHNASDTDTSIDVVNNIKKFGDATTLYMSGTPFNELINNSGFNKNGVFNSDALIIYDLGDLLKSPEYANFKLEHYLMRYSKIGEQAPDCNFDFEDEDTVRSGDDKNNTFRRFVEELNVIKAFEHRKTSLCYMSSVKCVKVAVKYLERKFKGNENWAIFSADNLNTKAIMEQVEIFHKAHPDGHCVIVTCDKFVMGATIKTCDAVHFMKRIGSAEFSVQAWGRVLTLNGGKKTSAGIYYYDDKSFWNLYLKFDISHERLTHERKNDYYKNGEIVFEHIYRGMNQVKMSDDLVNVYLKKYRELASKESAIDTTIATSFDFDSDIDVEDTSKKSSKKKKEKDPMFPGDNEATSTQGVDEIPRDDHGVSSDGDSDGESSGSGKKEVSRKEKVIQFMRDHIMDYMYFATSLFTIGELNYFKKMSETTTKCSRHECSLGIVYRKQEFDKYINKIRMMKTHIIGGGQWEKMCDSCRDEILTRFHSALEFTKSERYKDTFGVIDRKIVDELYKKNESLVAINQ